MEQNIGLMELEEMKNQISMLKNKLDSQEIINKRLLEESMKSRLKDINNTVLKTVLGCLVAIALSSVVFIHFGFSETFIVTTIIMLLLSASITIYYHRNLWKDNVFYGNLVDVVNELMLLKKRYENWKGFAIPAIVLWFVWLTFESYAHMGETALPFCAGALSGGLIGGIYGFRTNRQTIKKIQRLLDEIQCLKDGRE